MNVCCSSSAWGGIRGREGRIKRMEEREEAKQGGRSRSNDVKEKI